MRYNEIIMKEAGAEQDPRKVGDKVRGRVYVTSRDNMSFWGGYFPGLSRATSREVPATIRITEISEAGEVTGEATMKGVRLELSATDDDAQEWSIRREVGKKKPRA